MAPPAAKQEPYLVVVTRLKDEFGDQVDELTIRHVATEEVAAFRETKVSDYVPILAWRKARARLASELGTRRTSPSLLHESTRNAGLPAE